MTTNGLIFAALCHLNVPITLTAKHIEHRSLSLTMQTIYVSHVFEVTFSSEWASQRVKKGTSHTKRSLRQKYPILDNLERCLLLSWRLSMQAVRLLQTLVNTRERLINTVAFTHCSLNLHIIHHCFMAS